MKHIKKISVVTSLVVGLFATTASANTGDIVIHFSDIVIHLSDIVIHFADIVVH